MEVVRVPSSVPFDSNVYLVSGEQTALIDCGTGLDRGMALKVSRALGGRALGMILLTHCHADHAGGAKALSERFGCPIRIGARDAPHLRNAERAPMVAGMVGVDVEPTPCEALEDGREICLGGSRLAVIATPGHTGGSVCFYDSASGSLFSGDTVFAQGYGRTDLPTGSDSEMRASLRRLRDVNIKTMYPGHGPVCGDGSRSVLDALGMMDGRNR